MLAISVLWPWPLRYDIGSGKTMVLNIIKIQHGSEELRPRHHFSVCMQCDLDLRDMTLVHGHDTPLGHGQQLCKILSRSNMAVKSHGPNTNSEYVCTVTLTLEIWTWVTDMTHPFGSSTTIVRKSIHNKQGSEELLPEHGFWACLHCDLDLGDMTLGETHDTSFGHGQQLCEILSRSNTGVRSYGHDKIWTDRQTGRFLNTPLNFVCRGYKTLFVGGIETLLGYNKIDFVGRIKITYIPYWYSFLVKSPSRVRTNHHF